MIDRLGRDIYYMRVSLTDRCNLRCRYCMPAQGVPSMGHDQVLRYEELLELSRIAASLGITRFKITGGEPLVRRGCVGFIRDLKGIPGVEQVTLTTNGQLLERHLDELLDAGIDGVNISLDTLDEIQYRKITRSEARAADVLAAVERCARVVPTKLNAVLLEETADQVVPLARLAEELPIDVRFIETMAVAPGAEVSAQSRPVLEVLREVWPDLEPTEERRGNGPAVYYGTRGLRGRIGLIEAMRHSFCGQCNRVRLTSAGMMLPCLYYDSGADLRLLLREGRGEEAIRRAMEGAIFSKPEGHRFCRGVAVPGHRQMNQIGG